MKSHEIKTPAILGAGVQGEFGFEVELLLQEISDFS